MSKNFNPIDFIGIRKENNVIYLTIEIGGKEIHTSISQVDGKKIVQAIIDSKVLDLGEINKLLS